MQLALVTAGKSSTALVCSAGFIVTHISHNQSVLEAREAEHRFGQSEY